MRKTGKTRPRSRSIDAMEKHSKRLKERLRKNSTAGLKETSPTCSSAETQRALPAFHEDVLAAAIHLQACKMRSSRNGFVKFHFTGEGKININATEEFWRGYTTLNIPEKG